MVTHLCCVWWHLSWFYEYLYPRGVMKLPHFLAQSKQIISKIIILGIQNLEMASEGASNEPVDCDNTEDPVLLRCSPLRQRLDGPKTGDKSSMRNKEPIYIADDKFFDVHAQLQLRGFRRWWAKPAYILLKACVYACIFIWFLSRFPNARNYFIKWRNDKCVLR